MTMTPADADRTAFLFNLTQDRMLAQRLSPNTYQSYGAYQTVNHPGYGPTFGAGHDLYVNTFATATAFDWGSSLGTTYGSGSGSLSDANVFADSGQAWVRLLP